jgi:hypothetical protein
VQADTRALSTTERLSIISPQLEALLFIQFQDLHAIVAGLGNTEEDNLPEWHTTALLGVSGLQD